MLVSAELTNRLLRKAVQADPSLVADPMRFAELSRQVARAPEKYCTDDEDRAFMMLDRAVVRARQDIDDELDRMYYDQSPVRKPPSKLPQTHLLLERCIQQDPHCYDAVTLDTLLVCDTFEEAISRLEEIEPEARAWCHERSAALDDPVADPWDAIFLRPWLRMRSRCIDLYIQASCYRRALALCEEMLAESPADGQGIRHTAALLYARLEDEEGLNGLDARFEREGSCWMHVSRALLLYKLGRMDAARRAVCGLAELCPGAAHYLANPGYVQPYLPDRPMFKPGSAEESLLATYEADYLVMDTPEFVDWAMTQPRFAQAADRFVP